MNCDSEQKPRRPLRSSSMPATERPGRARARCKQPCSPRWRAPPRTSSLILRKQRVPFTSLEIEADAERAAENPKVFTKIRMHYKIRGSGVSDSAVKRAIDLSSEKYCTVGIMLRRGGVEFVNTHEILPME